MVHDLSAIVSRPVRAIRLAAGLLAVALPAALSAQGTAVARIDENVRAEPNEVVLGVLRRGAEFTVLDQRAGWVQVELEGWVWVRSLQVTDRDGFDLVVVPEDPDADGENLRAEPRGAVSVRLERGALLHEVDRIPGWVQVRRRAWVWRASVDIEEAAPSVTAALTPSAGPTSAPDPVPDATVRVGARGMAVLGAPDGDTLATAAAGSEIGVLAREGNWARVRIDGWVWMPDTATVADADTAASAQATPEAVATDPARWRGRIVSWDLQFISLERAESVRSDFYEGEPFLLTRPEDGGAVPFVYVALPPELLARGEGLQPLERITVRGRVRVGASTLTGSPILDLIELRRRGGR